MQNEKYYQHFLETNPYPRQFKTVNYPADEASGMIVYQGDRRLINFSSSDYLGLSRHPHLIARSQEYAQRWGVGSCSSRLVTGNLSVYDELENQLATKLGKPAALILGSGFQTNISVLEALLDERVLGEKAIVFCDKYSHVSLLAMTQHIAEMRRFRHNDLDHLQAMLEKNVSAGRPVFIVVESLYSMEGDQCDLARLVKLAKTYHAFLYVDDAHAVGLYGQEGFGHAPEHANEIDMIMGTFSKGLGSFGGYVGCTTVMKEYLINKCRGLIYSTGSSPAVLGAMSAALELVPQLSKEREQVIEKANRVRSFFREMQLDFGHSTTQIIPWIIGDADRTQKISELLEKQGILATCIRPPSVPPNKSRIRFCITAQHSDDDIEQLICAIKNLNCSL